MGSGPLTAKARQLLAAPNPAVIACLRADGAPVSVATWFVMDGDRLLVNMSAGRKRLQYLRDDPRASLTVLADDNWYTHVSVQGRVVDLRDDPDLTDIDRIAVHYTGKKYADRAGARVSAWIDIEHWHIWPV